MKKDLFILSAPFQILSAIEAYKYFKTEEAYLIIFEDKSEEVNNILKNAYKYIEWKEIFVLPNPKGKSSFKNSLKFTKEFILKNLSFRHIFSGFLFSHVQSYIHKVLALNVKSEKIFALDDGMATANYEKMYLSQKMPFMKSIKWNIFGLKTNLRNKFSIFTFFDINTEIEIIKHNNFKNLKQRFKFNEFQTKKENFYFIGPMLIEGWKMSEENFENFMKKVFAFAQKHQNIYFVPHRHCSDISLKIVQKIGFQVLKFSKPIEFEFLERKEKPVNIASTTSTALLSLKVIFEPENVFSFQVSENEIREDRVDGMRNLYEIYSDFGIEIL